MLSRRHLLKGAAGLFLLQDAFAQGTLEKGVRSREGQVRMVGDAISTGADGRLVILVGRDAMLVRANSSLSVLANGFRLVTGAVLTVFSPGRSRSLTTPTATIGIRGTAVYLEAQRGRTYVCACYGEAELRSAFDPAARETVRTKRHEQPRFLMAKSSPQMLMQASVLNHTDAELTMLEKLLP
jgi:FecR protein